jgi:hypothetical protein
MIALFIISIIFGSVVSGITGIGILFWLAGGFTFFCGLPFALATSFIHGEVSYAQDMAEYREAMAEIQAEGLAAKHEAAEDARASRLVKAVKKDRRSTTYNDNRQIHFHGKLT